ncbi:ParA family protein [Lacticaseibacillus paracasei]|uniref:ParA family protein n=1 Tax=Lacticaseibacillus paracasei TaxID=1597 RepID=UPI001EDDD9EA|nr:ParA family protein [Lacticaseibacillus paracasei]MCG4283250.1 ParA family protein [Lacticaseibacillus paracasei]
MAKTYVVGNFKGGVGKTKTVTMLAYESAVKKKRKTLVIDLDPQGNATSVLGRTGGLSAITKNVTDGFITGNLQNQITKVIPCLDIIGASTSFRTLPKLLMSKFPDDEDQQMLYLKTLLEPLKDQYDSIYLDVPPTISDFSDNAMMAADYCIIVLQTQELSLDGAKTYISYMQYLANNYNSDLDVLGIIPCMLRPGGRVDEDVLRAARDLYGNNVLQTVVKYQERLKAYDAEGIHINKTSLGYEDSWDIRAHKVFENVLDELDENQKKLDKYREGELNE